MAEEKGVWRTVGGKVYSKEVPINEVAWINGDEGQYANIKKISTK